MASPASALDVKVVADSVKVAEAAKQASACDKFLLVDPKKEIEVLVELADYITAGKDEAEQKKNAEKIRKVITDHQQYLIDFNHPMNSFLSIDESRGRITLFNLCFLSKNIPAMLALLTSGVELPADLRKELSDNAPGLLADLERGIQKRKDEVSDYKREFQAYLNEEQEKRKLEIEQEKAEFRTRVLAFQAFVKKQEEDLKTRVDKLADIRKNYSSDFGIEVMAGGPQAVKKVADAICYIAQMTVIPAYAHGILAQNEAEEGLYSFVYYYCLQFREFLQHIPKVNDLIETLPGSVKQPIKSIVLEDRAKANNLFTRLRKLLASSPGIVFLKRYETFIRPEMFQGIWELREDFSHLDLANVNAKYFEFIESTIREYRKKLEGDCEVFRDLAGTVASEQFKESQLRIFDSGIKAFLNAADSLKLDPKSFKCFVAYYKLELTIQRFLAAGPTLCFKASYRGAIAHKSNPQHVQSMLEDIASSSTANASDFVSHADRDARDRRRRKEKERARRYESRVAAAEESQAALLWQAAEAKDGKEKAEVERVKRKILDNLKNLSKEENSLVQDILNGAKLNRVVDEEAIRQLARKLELPYRKTRSGGIIQIHTESVSFHHAHEDRSGKLVGEFIANFRKAFFKIGITVADLPKAAVAAAKIVSK